MTSKVKGWLMLSPIIIMYVVWQWHMSGWKGFLFLAAIPAAAIYLAKAMELINKTDK